jgi:hypothetical protein
MKKLSPRRIPGIFRGSRSGFREGHDAGKSRTTGWPVFFCSLESFLLSFRRGAQIGCVPRSFFEVLGQQH